MLALDQKLQQSRVSVKPAGFLGQKTFLAVNSVRRMEQDPTQDAGRHEKSKIKEIFIKEKGGRTINNKCCNTEREPG